MDLTYADDEVIARFLDLSPFPAVVTRLRDHAVLAVNDRTATLFGGKPSAAAGRSALDFYVNPAQRQELAEIVRRDGRADDFRYHLRRLDGSTFWTLASSRLVRFGGEPAILTAFNNISEQLAASERRLVAQSRALTRLTGRHADSSGDLTDRLREILETSARTLNVDRLSLWRLSEDKQSIVCAGMYLVSSDQHDCGASLGNALAPAYFAALSRDRVIAAHDAITDPRTRELAASYLVPLGIGAMLDVPLRQDNATIGVLCAEHVGSERAWTVDEQNFALSAANLVVVALTDHQRRQAITKLADSEARARQIIDTAHDAFVGIDSTGAIIAWNSRAESTFGWTAADVIGRSLAEVIVPHEFREAHTRGLRRFLQTGDAPIVNKRMEMSALHRSGRVFPIELTVTSPTPYGDGYFFGAFLRDISERREHDEQLRRAKESAEAATRAKSEFLANMSHELRTPLNGVLGYAQLLQRDRSIGARQREALDAITKCGSHLLDVINEILDLSKIEAGRVETQASVTDLGQMASDLVQLLGESVRRKRLRMRTSIAPDVPRFVVIDGRHLRQVLLNLLGNAVKFTDEGEVRLNITRAGADRLLFEVIDTGIGIEPEALGTIFDAFTQTTTGVAAGGTGLGLTISRHLVSLMDGDLSVESVPGSGSRFFFTLPLTDAGDGVTAEPGVAAEPPLNAELAPGQTLTVLIADDSALNRRLMGDLLESAGAHVLRAAGGEDALRLAFEHRPDVVLMDLRMPDLDGLEATRRLRRDRRTAHIPVIAVTASALGDSQQTARDAGCVDYVSKPVRAQALFAVLQARLGVRFAARPEPAAADGAALDDPVRRVMVANRIRHAAAVGDVTAVESLVAELAASPAEATLGQRIEQLAATFDFDALRALADALDAETEHDGA